MTIMANDARKSKLNKQIDESLRKVYDEHLQAPVPDRFARLLKELREHGRAGTGHDDEVPPDEGDASKGRDDAND